MEIRSLGHAGFDVTASDRRVLLDPWFDPAGAFLGSWFPYPDNHCALTPDLFSTSALVISHEHLDHLDPWFIQRLPSDVPAVTCRFPSFALRNKILSAGPREIIELGSWEPVSLGDDITIFFVAEESPMNHDAAIIVTAGESVFVDLNDARLTPGQLREIGARVGNINVLALQGAGASWYPICYDYPIERRRELSRLKRDARFAYMLRAIDASAPDVVVPSAGPPCFLEPALSVHNDEMVDGIFPDLSLVTEWLRARVAERVEPLLPGDVWDVYDEVRRPHPQWSGFELGRHRTRYLEQYARRRRPQLDTVYERYPEPQQSLWPEFKHFFGDLLEMNSYFLERINLRVGFDITGPGGGAWSVDFRPEQPAVVPTFSECEYAYRFDGRWLAPLLDGTLGWEDFLLSLRFSARRDPDVYNDHLLGLLKFATPSALAAVEHFEQSIDTQETIALAADGVCYRVQRWCPHAGHDLLETGEVLAGRVLRCLAHHYEFDLETGQCLTGRSAPLFSQRL